jgi:AraC-like DNA-binding protein
MIKVDRRWRIYFSREHTLIPELRLVGWSRFLRADNRALPPHHHGPSYEIHLLIRGRLDLVVDDQVHNLRAGHIFTTGPNEIHGGVGHTLQQSEFYWIQFFAESVDDQTREILDSLVTKRVSKFNATSLDLSARLVAEHLDQRRFSALAARSTVGALLVELGRCAEPSFNPVSPIVAKCIERLRQDLSSAPTVQMLARELGVSPTQLTERFREEIGESLPKWLLHERLDRACRLIGDGAATREVASRLGYSSAQNFATTFRRELGYSPSEYRSLIADGNRLGFAGVEPFAD